MAVRILVVDDHDVVRAGVKTILGTRSGWEICGEATNGKMAVEMARELKPDLIVMDITMPVMSGLDAAKAIAREQLPSRILVLSMHELRYRSEELEGLGIQGYVLKSNAVRDLIRALEVLLEGKQFLLSDAQAPADKAARNPGSVAFCWGWSAV